MLVQKIKRKKKRIFVLYTELSLQAYTHSQPLFKKITLIIEVSNQTVTVNYLAVQSVLIVVKVKLATGVHGQFLEFLYRA